MNQSLSLWRMMCLISVHLVLFCNSNAAVAKPHSKQGKPIATVQAQVKAFNDHDVEAIGRLLAENVKWYSVDGDKIATEGDGRDAIKTWLREYFQSLPDVSSRIRGISQVGPLVSFCDRASWTKKDGTKLAQQSLAVYEVKDGFITRVWYFPAVRE